MVNAGVTHYDSTYFKLTTDVHIDSTTSWQPIGLNETYYFGGHFNGDNHLVTLYITTSTLQYVGIFGYVTNGSITNLVSTGNVNSSEGCAGGICSGSFKPNYNYSGNTVIRNCYNTGFLLTGTNKGGISGSAGYIINCTISIPAGITQSQMALPEQKRK